MPKKDDNLARTSNQSRLHFPEEAIHAAAAVDEERLRPPVVGLCVCLRASAHLRLRAFVQEWRHHIEVAQIYRIDLSQNYDGPNQTNAKINYKKSFVITD